MTICFDTDGVLINKKGEPILSNIELAKILSKDHKVFIWSGNGWEYAQKQVGSFLHNHVSGFLNKYATFKPDIAFDDQEIDLGKLNIRVIPEEK